MTDTASAAAPLPDAEALYQSLRQQVQALCQPHTHIVGITSGGAWLAERLQQEWDLSHIGIISTALHRDDFAERGLSHAVQTTLPFEVNQAHIVLLDDVLYTGRTIRAALNEIFDFGRPASVQLAVLVDRGCRQLPVCADVAAAQLALPASQSLRLARADDGGFSFRLKQRHA